MEVSDFRAMGSRCRVVVDGGDSGLAVAAERFVRELEGQWSRFDSSSDVSKLNEKAGRVVLVSKETFRLIDHAVVAQRATTGRFNALMLDQLIAHGYSKSWDEGVSEPSLDGVGPATHASIELYPEILGVGIPEGSRFDPGGIGKGLAADMVTEFLIERGATSSSVELGGDLRVHGTPWYSPHWRIGVTHPFDPESEVAAFTPASGAVATSSRLRRRWSAGGQNFHHLLDPLTGRPAQTDVATASCCAAEAWWAEVAAKVALIAGSGEAIELLEHLGVAGVIVLASGEVRKTVDNSPTEAALEESWITA